MSLEIPKSRLICTKFSALLGVETNIITDGTFTNIDSLLDDILGKYIDKCKFVVDELRRTTSTSRTLDISQTSTHQGSQNHPNHSEAVHNSIQRNVPRTLQEAPRDGRAPSFPGQSSQQKVKQETLQNQQQKFQQENINTVNSNKANPSKRFKESKSKSQGKSQGHLDHSKTGGKSLPKASQPQNVQQRVCPPSSLYEAPTYHQQPSSSQSPQLNVQQQVVQHQYTPFFGNQQRPPQRPCTPTSLYEAPTQLREPCSPSPPPYFNGQQEDPLPPSWYPAPTGHRETISSAPFRSPHLNFQQQALQNQCTPLIGNSLPSQQETPQRACTPPSWYQAPIQYREPCGPSPPPSPPQQDDGQEIIQGRYTPSLGSSVPNQSQLQNLKQESPFILPFDISNPSKRHKTDTSQESTHDHRNYSQLLGNAFPGQPLPPNVQQGAFQHECTPTVQQPSVHHREPFNHPSFTSAGENIPYNSDHHFNGGNYNSENIVYRQAHLLRQQAQEQIVTANNDQVKHFQQQQFGSTSYDQFPPLKQQQQQQVFGHQQQQITSTNYGQPAPFQQQQNLVGSSASNEVTLVNHHNPAYTTSHQNPQISGVEEFNNFYQQYLLQQNLRTYYQNQLSTINQGVTMGPCIKQEPMSNEDQSTMNNGQSFVPHQYQNPINNPNLADVANHHCTGRLIGDHDHQYALPSFRRQNESVLAPNLVPNSSHQSQNVLSSFPIPSQQKPSILVANPNYWNQIKQVEDVNIEQQRSYAQPIHQQQSSAIVNQAINRHISHPHQKPNSSSSHQNNIPSKPSQADHFHIHQNGCKLNPSSMQQNLIAGNPGIPQQSAATAVSNTQKPKNCNTKPTSTPFLDNGLANLLSNSGVFVLPAESINGNTLEKLKALAAKAKAAKAAPTIMRDPNSNRTFQFTYAGSSTKREEVVRNPNLEIIRALLGSGGTTSLSTSTIEKEAAKTNAKPPKAKINVKPKKNSGNTSSKPKNKNQGKKEPTSTTSDALNLVKSEATTTTALNLVKSEANSTAALNLVKTEVSSSTADKENRKGQKKQEFGELSPRTKAKLKLSTVAIPWKGGAESSGLPEEAKAEYERIKKNADMHKVFHVKKRLHRSGKNYIYHVNKSRTGIRIRSLDPKKILNRAKNNMSSRRSRSKRKMEVNVCQTEIVYETKLIKKYDEMEQFMLEQCKALERLCISKGLTKETLTSFKERAGFDDPFRRLG